MSGSRGTWFAFALLCLPTVTLGGEPMDLARSRRILALLGGIEAEYREAFDAAGRLTRPRELAEARLLLGDLRLLTASSGPTATTRPASRDPAIDLRPLTAAVETQASARQVSEHVAALRQIFQGVAAEEFLPPAPPDAARGAALFREHCTSCHGSAGKGDGPAAVDLAEQPADFTDPSFMRGETPSDFVRVVALGRRTAGMPAWEDVLDLRARWDVVSWLWSLGVSPQTLAIGARVFTAQCDSCHGEGHPGAGLVALDHLAERTDQELHDHIHSLTTNVAPSGEPERWPLVAELRRRSLGISSAGDGSLPSPAAGRARAIARIERRVRAAIDAYRLGEDDAAARAAQAYLEFEPLEPDIAARDPETVRRVERAFDRLRDALRQPGALGEVEAAGGALARELANASSPSVAPGAWSDRWRLAGLAVLVGGILGLVLRLWPGRPG